MHTLIQVFLSLFFFRSEHDYVFHSHFFVKLLIFVPYKITVFSALAACSVTFTGIGSFVRYLLFCDPLLWLNPAGSKTSQPLPHSLLSVGWGRETEKKKKSKICRLR